MSGGPDPRFVVCTECRLMRLRYADTRLAEGWAAIPRGAIHGPDHQIFPNLAGYLAALGRSTDHLRRPGWADDKQPKDD